MGMTYEYNMEKVYTKAVDIEDPGNCCIECSSPDGSCYYLRTQSVMGFVYVLKFGPLLPDLDVLDPDIKNPFELVYKQIKYSEKSIDTEIKGYINDPKKVIKDITEIDEQELLSKIPEGHMYIAA